MWGCGLSASPELKTLCIWGSAEASSLFHVLSKESLNTEFLNVFASAGFGHSL